MINLFDTQRNRLILNDGDRCNCTRDWDLLYTQEIGDAIDIQYSTLLREVWSQWGTLLERQLILNNDPGGGDVQAETLINPTHDRCKQSKMWPILTKRSETQARTLLLKVWLIYLIFLGEVVHSILNNLAIGVIHTSRGRGEENAGSIHLQQEHWK